MKFKITREQKIGLFAIITISSIFILINYLKGQDLFSKKNTYFAIYENVEGLAPTGPVYIRGLKVGTVEKIAYVQQEDYFVVEFKIKSDYAIADNSIAEIYSSDLLGSKAVRINIGNNAKHLKNNDTLLASTEPGFANMITQELIPLKKQAEVLIASMSKTFNNINDVLDTNAKENLSRSLSNLNKTLSNIEHITYNVKNKNPEIASIIENLNNISVSLNDDTKNLKRGINNFASITDSLKNSDFTGTIESLKQLLIKIQDPKGSLGKLITTDTVHSQVNKLLSDIDELIKNINKNPKKYIKVSVF